MFDVSELFLPRKQKLNKKEKLALSVELWNLQKQWKFDTSLGIYDNEVEDRIAEINGILEDDEEEYYSDFEHTPRTI
jgi:hypothetical protein